MSAGFIYLLADELQGNALLAWYSAFQTRVNRAIPSWRVQWDNVTQRYPALILERVQHVDICGEQRTAPLPKKVPSLVSRAMAGALAHGAFEGNRTKIV
jgi:hypothetical protein